MSEVKPELDFWSSSPAGTLRRLDEAWERPSMPSDGTLPVDAITELPEVFQLRAIRHPDEDHVERLRRIVCEQGALDPVDVVPVAGRHVLVDGHHRLEAYRQAGWKREPVPARILAEQPSQAVLRAGEANSRTRLPMRESERSEAAWKLVNLAAGGVASWSKAQIARAASVSERTVANMRRVRKTLVEHDPEGA